jgi:hypothetical protein
MLLDLRVLLAASLAAVLLLIGGFGVVAMLRTPGKPSTAIAVGSEEITGAIGKHGEKSQSLTDNDRAARPVAPAAEPAQAASAPARTVNAEKAEKAEVPPAPKEDEKPKVVAKPKPRVVRQDAGANFRNNNPFAFPLFGSGGNAGQ